MKKYEQWKIWIGTMDVLNFIQNDARDPTDCMLDVQMKPESATISVHIYYAIWNIWGVVFSDTNLFVIMMSDN